MFEHITNCHGEWGAVAAFISSLPLLSLWAKNKLGAINAKKEKENN